MDQAPNPKFQGRPADPSDVFKLKDTVINMGLTAAQNSFQRNNSASRKQMGQTQATQGAMPAKPDKPIIYTSFEKQLADCCFDVVMPADGEVVTILKRWNFTMGRADFDEPKTLVFYNYDEEEYDCLDIEPFSSTHEKFGYKNIIPEETRRLRPNVPVALHKDTKLAYNPGIDEDGNFSNRLELETCYMSHEATIEDGYWISDRAIERAQLTAVEQTSGKFGRSQYPALLYGRDGERRPCPFPGEKVRDDGIAFCFREYDEVLDAALMCNDTITRPIGQGEIPQRVKPGAVIHDIDIITNHSTKRGTTHTSELVEIPLIRQWEQKHDYNKRLIELSQRLWREDNNVKFSDRLTTKIEQAYGDHWQSVPTKLDPSHKTQIQRTIRNAPLDDWQITLHYHYPFKTDIGAKFAILHGGLPH